MNDPISKAGMLYIVATPIGNLGDISQRALKILAEVDLILAEDTRHSRHLLNHFGIGTACQSCHEHNEAQRIDKVIAELNEGKNIALISDAGTPLISDPGFQLVRAVRSQGLSVSPIPGPSSIIAALSAAGLPTDSFVYDGFLPAKRVARKKQLQHYLSETKTVVLLESSHRIRGCLSDMVDVLGAARRVVLARELTKKFETIIAASIGDLIDQVDADDNQLRGEFVLLIEGAPAQSEEHLDVLPILTVLIDELPLKQAAALTAKITQQRKNDIYQLALSLKNAGLND